MIRAHPKILGPLLLAIHVDVATLHQRFALGGGQGCVPASNIFYHEEVFPRPVILEQKPVLVGRAINPLYRGMPRVPLPGLYLLKGDLLPRALGGRFVVVGKCGGMLVAPACDKHHQGKGPAENGHHRDDPDRPAKTLGHAMATSGVVLLAEPRKFGIAIIVAVFKRLTSFFGSINRIQILEDQRSGGGGGNAVLGVSRVWSGKGRFAIVNQLFPLFIPRLIDTTHRGYG